MNTVETQNFNNVDFNVNLGQNFNPADLQVDEVINVVVVVDVSPSIESYVNDLNTAFNDFIATWQKSHVKEKLLVSIITFNEDVEVVTGFQPVINITPQNFQPSGSATALYDAAYEGVKRAVDYRQNLENSGVMCKTIIFVITDGENNRNNNRAADVKELLEKINKEEKNVFSFTTVLFGVGSQAYFESAQKAMGIQHLAVVGNSGAEIRKMINIISSSISKTSSNQAVTF